MFAALSPAPIIFRAWSICCGVSFGLRPNFTPRPLAAFTPGRVRSLSGCRQSHGFWRVRGYPSASRGLNRSPPRLLLFPHYRATPSADVVENFFIEQHQEKTLSHWHGAFAGRAEELARLQVFKILLFVRWHHQNREPSILSCVSHHYFAEVLAQQQCPKRPDDILPPHNDGHLGCWRRVLTRIPFGSIFRNFAVHRDRDKPVAGTILKLDDLMA